MVKKVVGGFVPGDGTGSYVFVDLKFALLPASCPEPALVSGHRQGSAQFYHAVVSLGHLQLSARFIQVQASTHVSGQGDRAATLNAEVAGLGPCNHADEFTAVLQHSCNAA